MDLGHLRRHRHGLGPRGQPPRRLGRKLLAAAEEAARERGCTQVLVSSFTFQAPEFYRRHGYVEFARSEGIPVEGEADVHFRKLLGLRPTTQLNPGAGPTQPGARPNSTRARAQLDSGGFGLSPQNTRSTTARASPGDAQVVVDHPVGLARAA